MSNNRPGGALDPYREAAARVELDGECLVRPSEVERGVLGLSATVPITAALVLLRHHHAGVVEALAYALFVASAFVFVWANGVRGAWVRIDEHGIAWAARNDKRRGVTWEDVASVQFARGAFVVAFTTGEKVSVRSRWMNADAFARAALARLPPEAVVDRPTRAQLETLGARRPRRPARRGRRDARAAIQVDPASGPIARWQENPFFVLGLPPECTRAEAERAGERLLGLLALGASAGKTYMTPFGPCERTPERVRSALAELREPSRRIVHEVWARVAPEETAKPVVDPPAAAPWTGAFGAAGWRNR